jgi:hypothetical protein
MCGENNSSDCGVFCNSTTSVFLLQFVQDKQPIYAVVCGMQYRLSGANKKTTRGTTWGITTSQPLYDWGGCCCLRINKFQSPFLPHGCRHTLRPRRFRSSTKAEQNFGASLANPKIPLRKTNLEIIFPNRRRRLKSTEPSSQTLESTRIHSVWLLCSLRW